MPRISYMMFFLYTWVLSRLRERFLVSVRSLLDKAAVFHIRRLQFIITNTQQFKGFTLHEFTFSSHNICIIKALIIIIASSSEIKMLTSERLSDLPKVPQLISA